MRESESPKSEKGFCVRYGVLFVSKLPVCILSVETRWGKYAALAQVLDPVIRFELNGINGCLCLIG